MHRQLRMQQWFDEQLKLKIVLFSILNERFNKYF